MNILSKIILIIRCILISLFWRLMTFHYEIKLMSFRRRWEILILELTPSGLIEGYSKIYGEFRIDPQTPEPNETFVNEYILMLAKTTTFMEVLCKTIGYEYIFDGTLCFYIARNSTIVSEPCEYNWKNYKYYPRNIMIKSDSEQPD